MVLIIDREEKKKFGITYGMEEQKWNSLGQSFFIFDTSP